MSVDSILDRLASSSARLRGEQQDKVMVSFCPCPHVEIVGSADAKFHVSFTDMATGRIVYETDLSPGHWAEPGPKYYVDWRIQVQENGQRVIDYRLDLKDKRVLVVLNSTSLGDTIAWMACVLQFQEKHGCKAVVQTHWNALFESAYPELVFEAPREVLKRNDYFCAYVVGCFDGDYNRNRNNWRAVPLQQIASDYLGLDYHCQRPRIARSHAPRPLGARYVAISEFANGYLAKQWLYPGAWQKLVDWLIEKDYQVISVSKEPSKLERVIKFNDRSIAETVNNIQHAEFFIGCSSGPSLLAWALGVSTVVISGFTAPFGEVEGIVRVSPPSGTCAGCINDPSAPLDRANFLYCPRGKNMVCSTSITPEMVIERISGPVEALKIYHSTPTTNDERSFAAAIGNCSVAQVRAMMAFRPGTSGTESTCPRWLIILPHCSTGGAPQYALKEAKELKAAGVNVVAVEFKNISDLYTVQRRKFQSLLGPQYHIVNEDSQRLMDLIRDFKPDVVHLQEEPERFLSDDVASELFDSQRSYQLIVTSHCSDYCPEQVRWWPDAFAWVSEFHALLFARECREREIPYSVVEYKLPRRTRPERTQALQRLGLNPERYHVLSVGLFAPWKDQATVWRVARELPHIQFHCIGNQAVNFRDYWEPLMADKPTNVTLWGERENVDDFYSAMDLLLFPSTKELFPLVIKEALSWQLPVLLRNLPVYGLAYDDHPLVTCIDGNPADQVKELLPSMAHTLMALYQWRLDLEEVPA